MPLWSIIETRALFLIQESLAVYVLQGITDTAGFNLNEKKTYKINEINSELLCFYYSLYERLSP